MKPTNRSKLALSLVLFGIHTSSAQTIETPGVGQDSAKAGMVGANEHSSFASNNFLYGFTPIPTVRKIQADLSEPNPVFMNQDALTLMVKQGSKRNIENVLDLSVLRDVSAYRQADRIKIKVSDRQASGVQAGLAELAAAYRETGQASDEVDCPSVVISLEQRIKLDPSAVLEIVESEISANPNCACEIVKTAIKASGADVSQVGYITEVAITSAPQHKRMISQCAIAAKPEALSAVQAILAKLDPNSGDTHSAKSGKNSKDGVASEVTPLEGIENPLDLFPRLIPPLPPTYIPPPSPSPPAEEEVVTDPDPDEVIIIVDP